MSPSRRKYSVDEINAAVEQLSDPKQLETAQQIVADSAPALQQILDQALANSNWFDSAHRAQLKEVATTESVEDRLQAIHRLITEETRVSMLVGVAIGFELGNLLMEKTATPGTSNDAQADPKTKTNNTAS